MKRVCALDVALQLEGRGKLAVAVLASGVLLPALTALLLKFQMVFHVVHKPVRLSTGAKIQNKTLKRKSQTPL